MLEACLIFTYMATLSLHKSQSQTRLITSLVPSKDEAVRHISKARYFSSLKMAQVFPQKVWGKHLGPEKRDIVRGCQTTYYQPYL